MEVNGKFYSLWGQFVEKQDEFVGGTLQDNGDSMDKAIFGNVSITTTITGIELTPNGDDSAFFSVKGKDFSCGFDVKYGGVIGGEEGWITFSGYSGHTWRIKKNE